MIIKKLGCIDCYELYNYHHLLYQLLSSHINIYIKNVYQLHESLPLLLGDGETAYLGIRFLNSGLFYCEIAEKKWKNVRLFYLFYSSHSPSSSQYWVTFWIEERDNNADQLKRRIFRFNQTKNYFVLRFVAQYTWVVFFDFNIKQESTQRNVVCMLTE